ncbi:MAG: response regulator transcription factor [Clostridiales bacterium]|jgi:DNA-binding response OmpR family regulator|nr:response regulator transcription factor [Clostridiales bacterium]
MNNILICDDDKDIVNALKIYLTNPNYKLFEAYNGYEALEIVKNEDIHLILLDIMMPQMDGMTAMAKIRENGNMPIIMLTAKSEESDKILGLNIGADDYITKPFNPLEVTARVNSQLRRYTRFGAKIQQPEVYSNGGIVVNDKSKTVTVDDEPVMLTPKEYEILKLLISSPDKVFSPKEIYSIVWKESPLSGNDNTVAVHIRHLREKIEINPNEPRYIKVIFGQGYKMEKGRRI